jgi:hypothetical protein
LCNSCGDYSRLRLIDNGKPVGDYCLLWCDTMKNGRFLPDFLRNVLPPPSE